MQQFLNRRITTSFSRNLKLILVIHWSYKLAFKYSYDLKNLEIHVWFFHESHKWWEQMDGSKMDSNQPFSQFYYSNYSRNNTSIEPFNRQIICD